MRFHPRHGVVVGVTGTNGKTTTATMIANALEASGLPTYLASTVGDSFRGRHMPPAPSFGGLVERLRQLETRGARAFVLECTSSALSRGFAKLVRFDVAVFTNLTQDHLDQHGSLEHYLASKAQLFASLEPGSTAVLNAADPSSALLDEVTPKGVTRRYYDPHWRAAATRASDLAGVRADVAPDGTVVELGDGGLSGVWRGAVRTPYVGEVFAENALGAALALVAAGVDSARVPELLARSAVVPGRFEVVTTKPVVAIDYAHTPDALRRTCQTARALAQSGRVIVVFGAGGGRDAEKRGPMGAAVGGHADLAIVTSDNPRHESLVAIASAIVCGARGQRAKVMVELDRRAAIGLALQSAEPTDVVLVCGKGHEDVQIVGDKARPFSDRGVVRELLGAAILRP